MLFHAFRIRYAFSFAVDSLQLEEVGDLHPLQVDGLQHFGDSILHLMKMFAHPSLSLVEV